MLTVVELPAMIKEIENRKSTSDAATIGYVDDIVGRLVSASNDSSKALTNARFDALEQLLARNSSSTFDQLANTPTPNAQLTVANRHVWGEGFHPVPLNYTLPILFMRQQWTLWHFGNRVENIAPHKFITNHTVLGTQKKK